MYPALQRRSGSRLQGVALFQHPLDQLAGGRAWKLVDEVDGARRLVGGHLRPRMVDQLSGKDYVGDHPGANLHDRLDLFAHLRIRHADHRDVVHGRVQGECVLHLLGEMFTPPEMIMNDLRSVRYK